MTGKKVKVLTVFGTRPEAIKMAPLVKALEKHPCTISRVAVTAQHRDMLDQVLQLFEIRPDYDLNIMQPGQTLFDITQKALLGLQGILDKEKPDIVLVHGDTTTTFAAALAAFYRQIPVGHVEAGLRTGNKYSPFPEEMNRKLTGSLTDLHFSPTATARENLLREGVKPSRVFVTGNTVIDALEATVKRKFNFNTSVLKNINFKNRVLLVTTHRRENLGEPLRNVYKAFQTIIDRYNDVEIVFPVHKNPAVRNTVDEMLSKLDRVHLIEPLDYQPFVNLMNKCYLVMTDSGGLQEEAPSLGKPVLVLRDTTERPEALEAGTVKVVGTGYDEVMASARELLDDRECYERMSNAVNPYGDGKASARIVQALLYYFQLTESRPADFIGRV